jgi:hypothetical protein
LAAWCHQGSSQQQQQQQQQQEAAAAGLLGNNACSGVVGSLPMGQRSSSSKDKVAA